MAEWSRTLICSILNCSSSHCCGLKPSSGHIWGKPSSACGWSGGFSQGSPVFAPLYDFDMVQNGWNNLGGRKTTKKTTKKQLFANINIFQNMAWFTCILQIITEIWLNQNSLEGDRPVSNQSLVGVKLLSHLHLCQKQRLVENRD